MMLCYVQRDLLRLCRGASDRPLESPHLHNKISTMLSTAVCQKHGLGLHGIAELVQHLRSQTFVAVLAQLVSEVSHCSTGDKSVTTTFWTSQVQFILSSINNTVIYTC